jgi:hypothetical protein
VPPNCRFEIDNAGDGWTYCYKFNYIYGRDLAYSFQDFPCIIEKPFCILYGGWLEFQDPIYALGCTDGSWDGTAVQHWQELILEGVAKLGHDWDKGRKYRRRYREPIQKPP